MHHVRRISLPALCAALVACGGDEPCDAVANTGCEDGQACELVEGGEPTCVAAVVVVGRVLDLETAAPIAGATVVALDANGAAASYVATSGADGTYTLPIPMTRTSAGTPVADFTVSLRADAIGYLRFPAGIRPALAFDTSTAVLVDGRYEIQSSLTEIGLLPLPGAAPNGTIRGTVEENASDASALVVAEVGGVGYTALAGRDGGFTIFNVPVGAASVQAYARGHNYLPVAADITAGSDVDVDIALGPEAASAVAGSVNIVNGQLGIATSVILVVESTFDATLARGETPPGLRAPDPGTIPSVDGAFAIAGVPAGRYVVLAAFENDNLVRDESSIGGTSIVRQTVSAGQDVTIAESFKVTGSVDIVSPGAGSPELVTGAPTFTWLDDSSEDRYAVTVFDSFGTIVWEGETPKSVVTLPYAGPALEAGKYYQFRVASIKDPDEVISRSEDLKGVFITAE